jgi:hypothetical protein
VKSRALSWLCLAAAVAPLGGCASAPASAPAPAVTPAAQQEPPLPRVSLLCHEGTTAARFEDLGVPREETPSAVVISGEITYVLFQPGRLLRITRKEGKIQSEMALSKPGETWAAMDVDPVDGSLWLVSTQDLALRQITPDWKTKTVKLQKVEGSGGFSRVLAATDALYVMPTSAEKSVWRISRDGKVLGTEFSTPQRDSAEPLRAEELMSPPLRLERDASGRILLLDPQHQALHQVDAEGHWSPAESPLLIKVWDRVPNTTVVRGVDVGGKDEQWYLAGGGPRGLFYWKGSPVFLGPMTSNRLGKSDTLLLVPRADSVQEMIETCYGASIQGVAATPERYAAYTWNAIIFGDFAGAPDLP